MLRKNLLSLPLHCCHRLVRMSNVETQPKIRKKNLLLVGFLIMMFRKFEIHI